MADGSRSFGFSARPCAHVHPLLMNANHRNNSILIRLTGFIAAVSDVACDTPSRVDHRPGHCLKPASTAMNLLWVIVKLNFKPRRVSQNRPNRLYITKDPGEPGTSLGRKQMEAPQTRFKAWSLQLSKIIGPGGPARPVRYEPLFCLWLVHFPRKDDKVGTYGIQLRADVCEKNSFFFLPLTSPDGGLRFTLDLSRTRAAFSKVISLLTQSPNCVARCSRGTDSPKSHDKCSNRHQEGNQCNEDCPRVPPNHTTVNSKLYARTKPLNPFHCPPPRWTCRHFATASFRQEVR